MVYIYGMFCVCEMERIREISYCCWSDDTRESVGGCIYSEEEVYLKHVEEDHVLDS